MRRLALALALSVVLGLPAVNAQQVATIGTTAKVTVFAKGLEHPWGLAFLPDGRALVTERPGRLRLVAKDGELSPPVSGVPDVYAEGQGGLLDVAVDPDFSTNGFVYLSYAEPGDGGARLAVARAKLDGTTLAGTTVIFRQSETVDSGRHFGSRLVFAPDGTLFITTGDRGSRSMSAQKLDSHIGKVLRINKDGAAPSDNPFAAKADVKAEIWSYGHRNIQGAAINPATGTLWTNEHGARGGDEVNHPEAGKNYGWPVITYGRDYSGAKIGIGTATTGMEQPVHYWDPSIAPSGMMFYTGDRFPAWKGSLFVGALAGQKLMRLTLSGDKVTGEEALLTDLARIRDVRQGPDGLIYLLTDDSDGAIWQIAPNN